MARLKKIGKYNIIGKMAESNYAEIYTVADALKSNFILKLARTDNPRDNELIAREYRILSQVK
ncbi:MAG: hypothetical protein ACFFC7_29040, partial [Candidatus Hermodarchaeota archaeon]